MKKRICLLAALGITIWALAGCNMGYEYEDADLYTPGDGSADPALVRSIEVDWPLGSVTVKPFDGDQLEFSDNSPFPSEENLLHSYLDGDTLKMQFCKSDFWGRAAREPKDLEVLIPRAFMENIQEISIDTESAAVFLNDVQTGDLEIHTKSGGVTVDGAAMQTVVETESGNIALSGAFEAVETESRSGTLTIICTGCPRQFTGESSSGDFQITLPADSSFSLEYTLGMGELISDFAGQESNGVYRVGDGSCNLSLETKKGNLYLWKQ